MPLTSVARELRRALSAKRQEMGTILGAGDLPPGQTPMPGSALASDSSTLLRTSYPVFNEQTTPLVDLSHMDGLRDDALRRVLSAGFMSDAPHSLVGILRRLRKAYDELGQPSELDRLLFKECHTLVGSAAAVGASELCRQARIFEASPTADLLEVLADTLRKTYAELIGRGLLQRPAAAADVQ